MAEINFKFDQNQECYSDLKERILRSNDEEYLGKDKPINRLAPIVSVIITTYQQADYIEECINGVLMQKTSFPFEIIIGEDDSFDGTKEICIKYAEKHPDRIRLFPRSRDDVILIDGFVTGKFNAMANRYAARGKYLAICEGDDYWTDPNKLAKQISFLEKHSDYILCCHDVRLIFHNVPSVPKANILYPINKKTFDITDVIENHFIPTLSMVFRNVVQNYPLWYINSISGDIALALLLLSQGKGYYFKEIMGVKRKNPGGVTRNPKRAKIKLENFIRMYEGFDEYTNHLYAKNISVKIASLKISRGIQLIKEKKISRGMMYIIKGAVKHPLPFIKKILGKSSLKTLYTALNKKL